MSYIQLLYSYVKNNKKIQFNLPRGYEELQYLKEVPYLTNKNPTVGNNLLNLLRNRDDLKKWLLATGEYGNEIPEDLNAIVGFDEKFNNAIVRRALDLKDQTIFRNPNPINVTFHDMKKIDLVNPVIGKLASQVQASKLTDYQLTKKLLQQREIDELQLRLDKLKYGIPKDDDERGSGGRGSGGGGGDGETSGLLPQMTVQEEMNDIVRRLNYLRGNTPDVSPDNTPLQNSRVVARKNNEKFVNQQIKERQREIANIPKGTVNNRKSSTNFNFPDTPPQTPEEYCLPPPPPLFDYEKDFPPLSREPVEAPLVEPRETSFLFSDGSLSPLRNKLPTLPPLPSKPSVDNF